MKKSERITWVLVFIFGGILLLLVSVISCNAQDTPKMVYTTEQPHYEAPIFAFNNKRVGVAHINKKLAPTYQTRHQFLQKRKDTLVISGLAWTFIFIVLVKNL